MRKKSYNEKLRNSTGLPKIEFIDFDSKMAKRFGSGYMLIAPPIEYDEIMKRIPEGKIITSNEIRVALAKKYKADFTCQLTAGIFINIAANLVYILKYTKREVTIECIGFILLSAVMAPYIRVGQTI